MYVTQFASIAVDGGLHDTALAEVQRFRGAVYVAEGNVDASELSFDGRHIQSADDRSWHILSAVGDSIESCGRICLYPRNVRYSDLAVSHSALAHCDEWRDVLRRAVEVQIDAAKQRGVSFAELGGWAIAPNRRCTMEAVRMVIAGYALAQLLGGAVGVTTANIRHHSASILRRLGGMRLTSGHRELPSYYEPLYRSELEILRFESSKPSLRFLSRMNECCGLLRHVTVIARQGSAAKLSPAAAPEESGVVWEEAALSYS